MSREEIVRQVRELGVPEGAVLVVHTAFSNVRPVEGGPAGLIVALQDALGPDGTLVMPSMSDDDEVPFDVRITSCMSMGIVAETFWKQPGVLRSDSPHAFAASGPLGAEITRPHPVEVPHGLDSPIGRVFERDGLVLLIGVGHDANTTIHLAENMAGVRYRAAKYATIDVDGRRTRIDYEEIDHCCQRFELMDDWLESQGQQRRRFVGHAEARLARSRDIVAAALARLRHDETIFLHPSGACFECDNARASLPGARPSGPTG
jgi:aminoglycoside N3'-acetyltransferase